MRSNFLRITPKLIAWSSVLVYAAVTFNDATTAWIGKQLADSRFRLLISFEGVILVLLILLANGVTQRLLKMDRIWDDCWQEIQGGEHVPHSAQNASVPSPLPSPPAA